MGAFASGGYVSFGNLGWGVLSKVLVAAMKPASLGIPLGVPSRSRISMMPLMFLISGEIYIACLRSKSTEHALRSW